MTNEELKKIREEKGQSKSEFAKLLGITPMMIGRYESGGIQIPEALAEKVKELTDTATASEIEVKKTARKTVRKAKEKVEEQVAEVKKKARKAAGPNIIIQSPMGGYISSEDIAKKVPKGTVDVYVRVDENKLYYVLADGETGDTDIWE